MDKISCIEILECYPPRTSWCESTPCKNLIKQDSEVVSEHEQFANELKEKQNKENEFVKKLREEGHKCIRIKESYPSKTIWCESTPCKNIIDDAKERQNKENEFVRKLREEGHTCIRILECFPSKTGWCHNTPCKNLIGKEKENN